MPVVAARRYTSGMCSQEDLAIDGDPRTPLPEGCFDWVGVAEPTSEEMELLRIQFGSDYDAYAARVKRFVPGLF